MAELITIGETMVAMVPSEMAPLRYVQEYRARIAGAESNVAMGVQKLGHTAAWISKLGDDEMGHFVLNAIRSEGVDCTGVTLDAAHRTGVMFKQRSGGETSVFYYRENAAASHLCPSDLDQTLFENAKILHITGITPVLSQSCMQTIDAAIALAKAHGMKVSFDPNIRKKLWGDIDYTPYMRKLAYAADILLVGLDEARFLFETLPADAPYDIEDVIATVRTNTSSDALQLAIKLGAQGAVVATETQRVAIPAAECHCVEPIGAGDAFAAGFLAGVLSGETIATCGEMGAIAGALATETAGDTEGQPSQKTMQDKRTHRAQVYR